MKAFSEAKDLAMADLTQTSALPLALPFLTEHAYRTVETMGEDFWPYGLESNRKTLETFVRYMHEQGMIDRRMPVEELFAPEHPTAPSASERAHRQGPITRNDSKTRQKPWLLFVQVVETAFSQGSERA